MATWINIKRFNGKYSASDEGEIKNNKTGKILKQGTTPKNYKIVSIGGKQYRVHRLVAEAHIPIPRRLKDCKTLQVSHEDDNPANNNVSNLRWCDSKYNNNHGSHIKKMAESLKNNPKISYKVVMLLPDEKTVVGEYPSYMECARQHGLSDSKISACARGLIPTYHGFIFRRVLS